MIRAVARVAVCCAALVVAWQAAHGHNSSAASGCSWTVERDGSGPELRAVIAFGREVWAVGIDARGRPAILRRARGAWKRMVLPALGEGVLNDISTGTDRIVWAVGNTAGSFVAGTEEAPLVLRWSGRGWKEVRGPRRSGLSTLQAVDAGQPAWIGGGDFSSGVYDPTVIQRRTPSGWKTLPGASISEGLIDAIDSSSPSHAWAVGYAGGAASITEVDALALRWDGRAWRRVLLPRERIPNPDGEPVDSLTDVVTVSADHAWAVGYDQAGGFALRWNGRAWTRTRMQNAPSSLAAVASRGSQTFAVGGVKLFRWGGQAWVKETVSTNIAGKLADVAIATRGEAWAVGGSSPYEGGPTRTLILRRSCS